MGGWGDRKGYATKTPWYSRAVTGPTLVLGSVRLGSMCKHLEQLPLQLYVMPAWARPGPHLLWLVVFWIGICSLVTSAASAFLLLACCTFPPRPGPQERHGSKMAFLDGAPPERLCQPMVDYFTARGGEVKMDSRLRDIVLNEDGSVKHYQLTNGDIVQGDLYISAVPGERWHAGDGKSKECAGWSGESNPPIQDKLWQPGWS